MAIALCATPPVSASLVLALDLPQMTAAADRVLIGEILSVDSAWDSGRVTIRTTIQVNVADMWKGDLPRTRTITIVQPGGIVGDVEMRVIGMPKFAAGERAVLFLRGDTAVATPLSVVGLGQGKRALRLDRATSIWMADPPDRSEAVTIDRQGKMHPAEPETAVPVDDLRRRVKGLLKP